MPLTSTSAAQGAGAGLLAAAVAAMVLAACSPGAPKGVSKDKLDAAVSDAIGDPATCVMIAEQPGGRIVYRYNTATACDRALPSCEGPSLRKVKELAELTAKDGQPRRLSCNSTPDGARGVSWASGVIPGKGLVYAAMMEGTRTFPGRMMADRLEPRLKDAGL